MTNNNDEYIGESSSSSRSVFGSHSSDFIVPKPDQDDNEEIELLVFGEDKGHQNIETYSTFEALTLVEPESIQFISNSEEQHTALDVASPTVEPSVTDFPAQAESLVISQSEPLDPVYEAILANIEPQFAMKSHIEKFLRHPVNYSGVENKLVTAQRALDKIIDSYIPHLIEQLPVDEDELRANIDKEFSLTPLNSETDEELLQSVKETMATLPRMILRAYMRSKVDQYSSQRKVENIEALLHPENAYSYLRIANSIFPGTLGHFISEDGVKLLRRQIMECHLHYASKSEFAKLPCDNDLNAIQAFIDSPDNEKSMSEIAKLTSQLELILKIDQITQHMRDHYDIGLYQPQLLHSFFIEAYASVKEVTQNFADLEDANAIIDSIKVKYIDTNRNVYLRSKMLTTNDQIRVDLVFESLLEKINQNINESDRRLDVAYWDEATALALKPYLEIQQKIAAAQASGVYYWAKALFDHINERYRNTTNDIELKDYSKTVDILTLISKNKEILAKLSGSTESITKEFSDNAFAKLFNEGLALSEPEWLKMIAPIREAAIFKINNHYVQQYLHDHLKLEANNRGALITMLTKAVLQDLKVKRQFYVGDDWCAHSQKALNGSLKQVLNDNKLTSSNINGMLIVTPTQETIDRLTTTEAKQDEITELYSLLSENRQRIAASQKTFLHLFRDAKKTNQKLAMITNYMKVLKHTDISEVNIAGKVVESMLADVKLTQNRNSFFGGSSSKLADELTAYKSRGVRQGR